VSFRGASPPEPPTRGSAPGPCWGTSVPQTLSAPLPPNAGYATWGGEREGKGGKGEGGKERGFA